MPEVCRFLGIIIRLNYNDHNPPHFHATYNEFEAAIEINNLEILSGKLPPKVFGLVVEWALIHQEELKNLWSESRKGSFFKIDPLV